MVLPIPYRKAIWRWHGTKLGGCVFLSLTAGTLHKSSFRWVWGRPVKFTCGISSGPDYLHWNHKKDISCYSASLIGAESVDDTEFLHCFLLLFCFYSDIPNFVEVILAQNWKYLYNFKKKKKILILGPLLKFILQT